MINLKCIVQSTAVTVQRKLNIRKRKRKIATRKEEKLITN